MITYSTGEMAGKIETGERERQGNITDDVYHDLHDCVYMTLCIINISDQLYTTCMMASVMQINPACM